MKRLMLAGAVAGLLAGCGKPSDDAAGKTGTDAPAKVAAISSEALCKLFTNAEIAAYIGPVTEIGNGGAATADIAGLATCIWKTADYRAMLTVTVKDVSDNPGASQLPLNRGQQFRLVPELGEDGFAEMTGASAMAGVKHGQESVSVLISAPKADTDQAIRLLRDVIERRGQP